VPAVPDHQLRAPVAVDVPGRQRRHAAERGQRHALLARWQQEGVTEITQLLAVRSPDDQHLCPRRDGVGGDHVHAHADPAAALDRPGGAVVPILAILPSVGHVHLGEVLRHEAGEQQLRPAVAVQVGDLERGHRRPIAGLLEDLLWCPAITLWPKRPVHPHPDVHDRLPLAVVAAPPGADDQLVLAVAVEVCGPHGSWKVVEAMVRELLALAAHEPDDGELLAPAVPCDYLRAAVAVEIASNDTVVHEPGACLVLRPGGGNGGNGGKGGNGNEEQEQRFGVHLGSTN
jgi:hypothetical protein